MLHIIFRSVFRCSAAGNRSVADNDVPAIVDPIARPVFHIQSALSDGPAANQVKECSRLAQDAVRDGMCVVIGLQSTGEANTSSERTLKGDELDDFVSVRKLNSVDNCRLPRINPTDFP